MNTYVRLLRCVEHEIYYSLGIQNEKKNTSERSKTLECRRENDMCRADAIYVSSLQQRYEVTRAIKDIES